MIYLTIVRDKYVMNSQRQINRIIARERLKKQSEELAEAWKGLGYAAGKTAKAFRLMTKTGIKVKIK